MPQFKDMLLSTERLILRRFTQDEFEDFYPLDQDPRVMEFLSECKPKPVSREQAKERFDKMIAYYDEYPGYGVFATCLKSDGSLIGWTALKDLDESIYTEIGYRYFFRFWGRGYATEAATALVDYGFEKLGLDRIVAVVHPDHVVSKAILRKIGLHYVCKATYYHTRVDFFEVLREEWAARTSG